MISLKLATLSDLNLVIRLALDFYEVSPYKTMRFDRSKSIDFFKRIVEGGHIEGVILIGLEDSKPVGILIGVQAEPVFSRSKMATELAWWISPDCRDHSLGTLLLDAYEDWAFRVGCTHVQVASLPLVSPGFLEEFYKSRQYVQAENSYMKVLKV